MDDNGAAFDEEFIANSKKQPFLKKKEKFDGNETVITVGKFKFLFDQNDSIFDLSQPCNDSLKAKGLKLKDIDLPTKDCKVCKTIMTDLKKVSQCDFCACFGCQECVHKQFPFPVKEKDKEFQFGAICLICETKLYINSVTQGIMKQHRSTERKVMRKEGEIE